MTAAGSFASTARVGGSNWRATLGTVQDNAHRGIHYADDPVSRERRLGTDRIPSNSDTALPLWSSPRLTGWSLRGRTGHASSPAQSHDARFTTDPLEASVPGTGTFVDPDGDTVGQPNDQHPVYRQDVGGYDNDHDTPTIIRAGASGLPHEIRPQHQMRLAYTMRRFPRSEQLSATTARPVRDLGAAYPNVLTDVTDASVPGPFVTSGSGFRQRLRSDLLTVRRVLRPWDENNVVDNVADPAESFVDHSAEASTRARMNGWRAAQ